ncbi:MAG: tetratricopeptide repeat protein [Smithellaceae bacterium]
MVKIINSPHYFVWLIPFVLLLLCIDNAVADIKTFEKEYSYQASEIDSKVTSRAIAVEQVKRLVLEELGTYLVAETEVRRFQISMDRVVMLTAGIVQTEILNEKWDGEKYYLKARIKADPKQVAVSLDMLRKDNQRSKELEDSRKKADDASKEIERLKMELEFVKASTSKQIEYAKAADTLSATDWFNKGLQYKLIEEYDKAIDAYTRAIALKTNYVAAYNNRGNAYEEKGQNDRAIKDYKEAIAIDSNVVEAYYNLGHVYNRKGQYDDAIENYNKAIKLDPNEPDAYDNRGFSYSRKGQYKRAIEDYNKSLTLKPDHANAYNNRGVAYANLRRMGRAISDFQKACDMGNKNGCKNLRQALNNR